MKPKNVLFDDTLTGSALDPNPAEQSDPPQSSDLADGGEVADVTPVVVGETPSEKVAEVRTKRGFTHTWHGDKLVSVK